MRIFEFTAEGTARSLAAAIEKFAAERRVVSALVVPWESSPTTLSMAVTSPKGGGWAIEHTNLGTITLADLGGGRTQVAVVAHEPGSADVNPDPDEKGTSILTAFARQLEQRFGSKSTDKGPTSPVPSA